MPKRMKQKSVAAENRCKVCILRSDKGVYPPVAGEAAETS